MWLNSNNMTKEYTIAVLKGDGIGPEVIAAGLKLLPIIEKQFDLKFQIQEHLIGAASIDVNGIPLTKEVLEHCKTADAILLGAIGDPKYDNSPDLKTRPEQGLLKLRKELGLFANIRPVTAYDALLDKSPLKREIIKGVDLVIYRELTGGIYFGEHGYTPDGVAYDHCTYSVLEIDRILHLAFKAAEQRKKHLTLVDKANVLETSRLWRKRAQILSEQYPSIQLDYLFVDNAAMQIILNPNQFDVIVTENMFGDILSDEASVIAGSIGLLASSSIGDGVALFEPIHGSFPQGAGKNIANPIAAMLSIALMFDYLKLNKAASAIESAVKFALEQGVRTLEISENNNYGTLEVTEFIVNRLAENSEVNI
ncbi:MAG: 3-isopropylmalate dehydrogenase [Crocinitomix sp.]|jgi:3-isopropylmalate dehydrogenase